MSSRAQSNNKRSFNRGGRDRGRGRGGGRGRGRGYRGRRNYRRRNDKMDLKPKEPEIKCRTKEDIINEQEIKIEKMMQYYEDNEKNPKLPIIPSGEIKKITGDIKTFNSKLYEDDGWACETDADGKTYFTHPYSELKYPVIYKKFGNDEYIAVPGYREDADIRGNSICKEPSRSNPLPWYFSELTYKTIMNKNGSYNVKQNSYSDFWRSRRGKRRVKYHYYIKKREEKKKMYGKKTEESLLK